MGGWCDALVGVHDYGSPRAERVWDGVGGAWRVACDGWSVMVVGCCVVDDDCGGCL